MRTVMDQVELSEKLRAYRYTHKVDGKKMTQGHLAKLIGIPEFTLWRWENMKVRISPVMLIHLKRLKII